MPILVADQDDGLARAAIVTILVRMKAELEEVAPDIGSFGFMVRWKADDYYVEFIAHEIITNEMTDMQTGERDTRPQYTRAGAIDSMDLVFAAAEAEVYVSGSIKWDGCATVDFGEGSSHMCGRGAWQAHVELMARIWRRAGELMGERADDGEFTKRGLALEATP